MIDRGLQWCTVGTRGQAASIHIWVVSACCGMYIYVRFRIMCKYVSTYENDVKKKSSCSLNLRIINYHINHNKKEDLHHLLRYQIITIHNVSNIVEIYNS